MYSMVFDIAVDTPFCKVCGKSSARVVYSFLVKDIPGRSLISLDATEVNRTILLQPGYFGP